MNSYERARMNLQLFGEDENEAVERKTDLNEDFERDGIESSLVMASVIAAKLDSIANALERIGDRLDALDEIQEDLDNCIGYIPPSRYAPPEAKGCNFFRIGGSVGRE